MEVAVERRQIDRSVPVFTEDVASANYPVFNGPATL